jgi:phage baseplate assembly protein W
MSSAGMDRNTGKLLQDWPHVLQSLSDIFTTDFGSRVMREYYGSDVTRLLGENMVPETFVRFFSAIGIALIQEPRVLLRKITPLSVTRSGSAGFYIEFVYRPRGHLGDFTPQGARKVIAAIGAGNLLTVTDA